MAEWQQEQQEILLTWRMTHADVTFQQVGGCAEPAGGSTNHTHMTISNKNGHKATIISLQCRKTLCTTQRATHSVHSRDAR